MIRRLLRLLPLLPLLFLVGCPPAEQIGTQMQEKEPVTVFEQEDFNRQMALLQSGKYDLGLRGMEAFIRRYPDSRLADDAYYQTGTTLLKLERFSEAAKAFQKIIERFPTSDTIVLAKYYFGIAHQRLGDVPSVLPVLDTVEVRTLPPEFRLSFLTLLRDAYRQQKANDKLFNANLDIVELNPGDTETRQEVLTQLEQMQGKEPLEALVEKYRDRFPVDYALMKLSRLYLQEGDFDRAKSRLSLFLQRFRDAGKPNEFTHEAESLLERLDRLHKVNPRTVGVLLPLSGAYEPIGRRILNGLLLGSGLFDGPEAGGAPDDGLQLLVRDSGVEPEQALKALDELVLDQQVVGVVGPALKKPSAAVAKAAGAYGIPTVLMSQDEGLVGSSPFIFQNCLLKSEQIKAMVKFAVEEMKIRRVAILYPTHNYGQEMFALLWDELAKYPDVEIRGVESYDKETNDFGNEIRRLVGLFYTKPRAGEICSDRDKRKKNERTDCFKRDELPPIVDFEALFIPDSSEKIRQIAPSLSYYGIRGIQLFGGNLWNTPDLLEKGAADYLQGAIYVDGFYPDNNDVATQSFVNRYRQNFGEMPDILAAQAYDTMMMLRQANRQNALGARDDLKRFLKSMPPFVGATGRTSFGDSGQAQRQLYFFMVDGSKPKLLF